MSTSVFPSLPGLAFPVARTPLWSTTLNESVSGKRSAYANWTYPRYKWSLTYNFLRADSVNHEWQDLEGFFNLRQGQFDTFLYTDANDNTVTGQRFGTGDGSTLVFQLARTLGNFTMPVYGPHTVSKVYVDGVDKAGHWTVSNWGTSTPGVITFDSAPGNTLPITADFTFYFPVRFDTDSIDFDYFMASMMDCKSVTFSSEK